MSLGRLFPYLWLLLTVVSEFRFDCPCCTKPNVIQQSNVGHVVRCTHCKARIFWDAETPVPGPTQTVGGAPTLVNRPCPLKSAGTQSLRRTIRIFPYTEPGLTAKETLAFLKPCVSLCVADVLWCWDVGIGVLWPCCVPKGRGCHWCSATACGQLEYCSRRASRWVCDAVGWLGTHGSISWEVCVRLFPSFFLKVALHDPLSVAFSVSYRFDWHVCSGCQTGKARRESASGEASADDS